MQVYFRYIFGLSGVDFCKVWLGLWLGVVWIVKKSFGMGLAVRYRTRSGSGVGIVGQCAIYGLWVGDWLRGCSWWRQVNLSP